MKVVGKERLQEFQTTHADVRTQLGAWLCEVENAQWLTPMDIKVRYANASFMSGNRVVFNLKGRRYRLDTKVNFKNQVVLIMRIGTHAEYSKWQF
jgi:mRNA interferase HigB